MSVTPENAHVSDIEYDELRNALFYGVESDAVREETDRAYEVLQELYTGPELQHEFFVSTPVMRTVVRNFRVAHAFTNFGEGVELPLSYTPSITDETDNLRYLREATGAGYDVSNGIPFRVE